MSKLSCFRKFPGFLWYLKRILMNRNGVAFSCYIIPQELPNILSGISMKYEVSNTKAFFYKFPDW